MALPNFIVAGAAKCGTTSIDDILKQHPDVYLPLVKEIHFFDDDNKYSKGSKWYENTFYGDHKGERAVGDITPAYMLFDSVPQRIADTVGTDIKIIFSMRDPVNRAYSDYINLFKLGLVTETQFAKAVEREVSTYPTLPYSEQVYYSMIQRSLYASHIKRFLDVFPKKNFLFILFEEDFLNNRTATFERIQRFIGVEPMSLDASLQSNPAQMPRFRYINRMLFHPGPVRSLLRLPAQLIPTRKLKKAIKDKIKALNVKPGKPPRLSPDDKNHFYNTYFKKDVEALENIIGRDLSAWK